MTLKFPVDLPSDYYMSMQFFEYKRPDPFSSLVNLVEVGPEIGSVILPMPAQLIDHQRLNWSKETINPTAELATAPFSGNWGSIGPAAGMAGIMSLPHIVAGLGAVGAQRATGGTMTMDGVMGALSKGTEGLTKNILQRSGLAMNPMLTQQFNSPDFKNHQFSWKLSPNSAVESGIMENIIKQVKFNSLPDVILGGMFFKYPSIVKIKLVTGSKELYAFQPAVITDVETNYAPSGTPSFFAGTQAPTSAQLTISFVEIVLNTRKNINKNSATDLSLGQNAQQMVKGAIDKLNAMTNKNTIINRGR